ncbi:MAG: hypothetical protein Q7S21_01570, partial [archaeon]|nr:hypothetical protein [archaeon]
MPILKGVVYHKGKSRVIETHIDSIRRKRRILRVTLTPERKKHLLFSSELAEGYEGTIHEVEVKIRGKKIVMVEKKFHKKRDYDKTNFGDPIAQFETMNKLIKLNKRKKLELRIVPTIRLFEKNGEHRLILTKLKIKPIKELTSLEFKQFYNDMRRQIESL